MKNFIRKCKKAFKLLGNSKWRRALRYGVGAIQLMSEKADIDVKK